MTESSGDSLSQDAQRPDPARALEGIERITLAARAGFAPDALARLVADQCGQLLGTQSVGVLRWDEAAEELVELVPVTPPQSAAPAFERLLRSATGEAARRREPVMREEADLGLSLVALPLVVADALAGVLVASSPAPPAPSWASRLNLLALLAAPLGSALVRERLVDQLSAANQGLVLARHGAGQFRGPQHVEH